MSCSGDVCGIFTNDLGTLNIPTLASGDVFTPTDLMIPPDPVQAGDPMMMTLAAMAGAYPAFGYPVDPNAPDGPPSFPPRLCWAPSASTRSWGVN